MMRSKDGLHSDQSGSKSAARAHFSFPRRVGGTGGSSSEGPYAVSATEKLTHTMAAFGGGGSHWPGRGRGKGKGGDLVHSATARNSSEEMIMPPGFEVTEIINSDVERGMGSAGEAHHQAHGYRQSVGGGIMVTTTYHVE